jgi:hypothetical protein
MASWLDACADGICERTPLEHTVQLVTTAREGNAAYHRDTAVVVQDLFRRAKRSVLISTYALHGGREIFQSLDGYRSTNLKNILRSYRTVWMTRRTRLSAHPWMCLAE